jgi:hypothetical protein
MDEAGFAAARRVIEGVIGHDNHRRLHSSLNFLRPVDDHRGNPEAFRLPPGSPLLAGRRRKLVTVRELREQENIRLHQCLLPRPEPGTVPYRKGELSHFE